MPAPRDETDLVWRLCRGDEAAFRAVYRETQPGLQRYLTTLVGVEAEDVAAEAWCQAVRDLSRFEGDLDGFRAWLTTIARHRALDLLRAQSRRPVQDAGLDVVFDLPERFDAEELALDLLGTQGALALVATLPPDQREAIMLRTVLGFDAPTAAQILGKRPGAVRAATMRGLRALERRLEAPPARNIGARRNTSVVLGAEAVR